jgi:archaellum component FlaC
VKAIEIKEAKALEAAVKKAAAKLVKEAAKEAATVAEAADAAEAKNARVEAVMEFNARHSNDWAKCHSHIDDRGDTLRDWAERVC